MADNLAQRPKQASFGQAFKLSFSSGSGLAIPLAALAIIRLLTAHAQITLYGIVYDIVTWYHKIYHTTVDTLIIKLNAALNCNLPSISDNVKDAVMLQFMLFGVLARSRSVVLKQSGYKPTLGQQFIFYIAILSFSIIDPLLFIIPNYPQFHFSPSLGITCGFGLITILIRILGESGTGFEGPEGVKLASRAFTVQLFLTAIAVIGLLVVSAYS